MAEERVTDSAESTYPARYVQAWTCRDGRAVTLRPICRDDTMLEKEFIEHLSSESSRYRFSQRIKEVTPEMVARFCNIDYVNEMAIIVEYNAGDEKRNVGVGRLIFEPETESGEFAIVVADDFQNVGLGRKLLTILIEIGQERGLKNIYGLVMKDNWKMLSLARKLGFNIEASLDREVRVIRELQSN